MIRTGMQISFVIRTKIENIRNIQIIMVIGLRITPTLQSRTRVIASRGSEYSITRFLLYFVCRYSSSVHLIQWSRNNFNFKVLNLMFVKQCSIHRSRANYIWENKTNKLQVHPYKPVSWSPTHQGI